MSYHTSLHNNEETPMGELYTDFSEQHVYTVPMFMSDEAVAQKLFQGCPAMPEPASDPTCLPMFYCPDTYCPPQYSHYYGGMCYKNGSMAGPQDLTPALRK